MMTSIESLRLPSTLRSYVSVRYRGPQYLTLTRTASGDASLRLLPIAVRRMEDQASHRAREVRCVPRNEKAESFLQRFVGTGGAMIRSIARLAALTTKLVFGGPLCAQVSEEHGAHAERLGQVRFATSCRGAAQSGVEHGVAYLHSFWYERAAQAFDAAAAADSSCAMAFWGQAMSLLHPLWTPPSSADARVAISAIDRGLAAGKTTRERDYLRAIRAYYADYDRTDPRARLDRYALAMDTVRRRSPSDREAAIFYALALIAVGQARATDTTFTYQLRPDSILEPLFRREPRHPGLPPGQQSGR